MTAPTDYRQHLEVETPEHVVLDYEIAGLGSRALAAMADTSIVIILVVAVGLLALWSGDRFSAIVVPLVTLTIFSILFGYFALFEGFNNGQTPGKRWMGIRVIRDTGHALTFREAAARNLVRLVDFLPPPYLLGALFVAFHPRGKRLGDLVAGTVVVRDRPVEVAVALTDIDVTASVIGAPLLGDDEFRLLREFGARSTQLPPNVRDRLAGQLVARLAQRFPIRDADNIVFLAALLRDEGARRRGRFAAGGRGPLRVGQPGGASLPTRATGPIAERLVARKGRRWDEFGALADKASRRGLDALTPDELPDFAARYREIASDLARVRTYGADALTRARLERLVASGHNLLYRDDRKTWGRIGRFIAVECPAGVVASWRVVLLASLSFALPALGGYATLRETPSLAEQVLPAVLLERASEGERELKAGRGYAATAAAGRAAVATGIITNNLRVSFACFAGGVALGIGSLVSLAYNGLLMGAASGHYQNVGLLSYLWTFVAGHGVLELFAIWCAGAGGFLLGLAAIQPGAYSRRDALVLNGRVAMRLVGTSVVLLLVAGTIEGFLSTSSASAQVKVGVSMASAVLLALYLANGARFRHEVSRLPSYER